MSNRKLSAFVSPFGAASQVIAGICFACLSALTPTHDAYAQTAQKGQSPITAIEVRGRKIPTGPHCIYMNWATLPVKYSGGRLAISAGLNGSAANMILDTGTLHTMLTRQEAQRHGLMLAHSKITETDADGKISATYATYVDDIALDKLVWRGIRLGVTSRAAAPYGALAGADILLNAFHKDLEISLGTQQIKFFVPAGCSDAFLAYWDDHALDVPLVDLSPTDPRQVVTVEINGHKMTALIDSGAPTSMIDLDAAARAGVTPQSAGATESKNTLIAGLQHGKTWLASFKSFTLGGETINNPTIGIADLWGPPPPEPSFKSDMRLQSMVPIGAPMPSGAVQTTSMSQLGQLQAAADTPNRPDMLLGADFLLSHRVLLAMSQRRMYFSYLGGKVFGADVEPLVANTLTAN